MMKPKHDSVHGDFPSGTENGVYDDYSIYFSIITAIMDRNRLWSSLPARQKSNRGDNGIDIPQFSIICLYYVVF